MSICETCGPKNCQTCGETDQSLLETHCAECSTAESRYYQLQKWRAAAMEGRDALLKLYRPKWWHRLLGVKPVRLLPVKVDAAVSAALELEAGE